MKEQDAEYWQERRLLIALAEAATAKAESRRWYKIKCSIAKGWNRAKDIGLLLLYWLMPGAIISLYAVVAASHSKYIYLLLLLLPISFFSVFLLLFLAWILIVEVFG